MKGLSHKEALVLLDCELEDKNKEIYKLAEEIKQEFYGNRIVMFAPLYLAITVSTAVNIVRIMLKINILQERS